MSPAFRLYSSSGPPPGPAAGKSVRSDSLISQDALLQVHLPGKVTTLVTSVWTQYIYVSPCPSLPPPATPAQGALESHSLRETPACTRPLMAEPGLRGLPLLALLAARNAPLIMHL